MAKTKTNTEEIIEKKESSPVATASLILSCVAMLGAIIFCVTEIVIYRTDLVASVADSDRPGMKTAERDLRSLDDAVNRISSNQAPFEDEKAEEDEDTEEDLDAEGDEDTDEDLDADEGF